MFPTISESRFNGSLMHYNNSFHPMTATNCHRSLSEEEQHLYNHHIIENFVESVREMNDVVLIPSKLKDLDQSTDMDSTKYVVLNDDLYSYYQMINVVKNDLFEPHNESDSKKLFLMPKRKTSRQHRHRGDHDHQGGNLGHSRNLSSSNLSSLINFPSNSSQTSLAGMGQDQQSPSSSSMAINSVDSLETTSSASSENGTVTPTSPGVLATNNPASLVPLSSEQLIGQNAKQLTVQFIHHLHSLYTILEHFTNAADFITERYMREVETSF